MTVSVQVNGESIEDLIRRIVREEIAAVQGQKEKATKPQEKEKSEVRNDA